MRARKDIEKDFSFGSPRDHLMLEVLLDIRELLYLAKLQGGQHDTASKVEAPPKRALVGRKRKTKTLSKDDQGDQTNSGHEEGGEG